MDWTERRQRQRAWERMEHSDRRREEGETSQTEEEAERQLAWERLTERTVREQTLAAEPQQPPALGLKLERRMAAMNQRPLQQHQSMSTQCCSG